MTVTVKIEGYPDRLACPKCGCELAARRTGEPWRSALPTAYYGPEHAVGFDNWTHVLEVDEPGVVLDLGDGCPCHESYLGLLENRYDTVAEEEKR